MSKKKKKKKGKSNERYLKCMTIDYIPGDVITSLSPKVFLSAPLADGLAGARRLSTQSWSVRLLM